MNEPGNEWLRNGINALSGTALGAAGVLATTIEGGALIGLIGGITAIAADYLSRSLSIKENERINTVAFIAAQRIGFNIRAGMELRKDNFFEVKGTRPAAEEIFEGVLNIARSEHEESKLPYLANLMLPSLLIPLFQEERQIG